MRAIDRVGLSALAFAVVMMLSAGSRSAETAAETPTLRDAGYGQAVFTGRLQNPRITEASGLACSRIRPDLLWVLNDSGNSPSLFAVGTNGADCGEILVDGATNRDWEDMASFMLDGKPRIIIGDIGDNFARRDDCVLYLLDEPAAPGAGSKQRAPAAVALSFRYEDGPRDCESLAVDTASRRVLLVSKRTIPPVLYELPMPEGSHPAPCIARRLGTVWPLPPPTRYDYSIHGEGARFVAQPTALDISPDGHFALLMNYRDAYLFERDGNAKWVDCLAAAPLLIPLPQVRGKEAACFAGNGRDFYFTCEGAGAPLFMVRPLR